MELQLTVDDLQGRQIYRGRGCDFCNNSGYKGRLAIFEIMVNTPSIGALIRDNKTFRINSDIQTGAKFGMVTLDGFLMEKYQQGLIARDEVVSKAQDPVTALTKLQEYELAQAVGQGGDGGGDRKSK